MGMMIEGDCHCCGKFARTGDFWHCEDCWNKHHRGLIDKDWEDRETFERNHIGMARLKEEIKERVKHGML